MTEHLKEIAAQLTKDLDLDMPPVQVSYLDAPPAGVPEHPGGVPSVCTFFALGTEKTFYAGLPQHEDCEIGAFVLGIPPEGTCRGSSHGNHRHDAEGGLPQPRRRGPCAAQREGAQVRRDGPLGSLPMAPTSVLLFARPDSAMLALETAGAGDDAQPVPNESTTDVCDHADHEQRRSSGGLARLHGVSDSIRRWATTGWWSASAGHLDQFAKKLSRIVARESSGSRSRTAVGRESPTRSTARHAEAGRLGGFGGRRRTAPTPGARSSRSPQQDGRDEHRHFAC